MWPVLGLGEVCRARTSDAGFSFETAISRTGFWIEAEEDAVLMRAVTAVRFASRAEVRAGVAAMFGSVIAIGCGDDGGEGCSRMECSVGVLDNWQGLILHPVVESESKEKREEKRRSID